LNPEYTGKEEKHVMALNDMLFVGLNGRVAALDRGTGAVIWEWRPARKGGGWVTLLLDRDLLLVAANGYLYALDAQTGEERWNNPLKGWGTGIACFAAIGQQTPVALLQQIAAAQAAIAAEQAAAAAGVAVT
jgi:hypothetical protein